MKVKSPWRGASLDIHISTQVNISWDWIKILASGFEPLPGSEGILTNHTWVPVSDMQNWLPLTKWETYNSYNHLYLLCFKTMIMCLNILIYKNLGQDEKRFHWNTRWTCLLHHSDGLSPPRATLGFNTVSWRAQNKKLRATWLFSCMQKWNHYSITPWPDNDSIKFLWRVKDICSSNRTFSPSCTQMAFIN